LVFCYANGHTPLMAAARMNDVALAAMLLDARADVDAGKEDCTPLMCACTYGHVEMARLLIERGANVNAVCEEADTDELTAVGIAGEAGNVELLELLWSAGAKTENKDAVRLVIAARAGDVKRITALLKAGVDINAADPFTRDTPVYAASVGGQPEALRALLNAGGSITPPRRGLAPLLMTASAICEGLPRKTKTPADVPRYVETLKILIDAGATVKVAMFGMTPLDLAQQAKCQPIIELFEAALANEKPASKGKTKKK
jgi:ankyrin repeat protein